MECGSNYELKRRKQSFDVDSRLCYHYVVWGVYFLGGSACILGKYTDRAIRLEQFQYLQIYVLSRKDIIVSKIIRMEPKDIEDMDLLIKHSDLNLISQIIDETLQRNDLYESKRETFLGKLPFFRKRYNVWNFCESYDNYISQYNNVMLQDECRYRIAKPLI